ncbi:MAG: Cas10/Cmr2 second palm domain-containing protein, partial [Candidatus Asgardarchaeia archaeon]
ASIFIKKAEYIGKVITLLNLGALVFSLILLYQLNSKIVHPTYWFNLYIDTLGSFITVLILILSTTAAYFSIPVIKGELQRVQKYYFWYSLFIFAMIGTVMSADILSTYLYIEGATIFSVLLVAHENTSEAFEASLKYLIICSFGTAMIIIALTYMVTLNITSFSYNDIYSFLQANKNTITNVMAIKIIFLSVFFGFGAKAGYVRTWDELGKLSYMLSKIEEVTHPEIALIKGDGDNFGTVKALMSSIATYKQISRLFSEISIEGVAYGFANVILMSLNEYAENYFKYIDTIYLPFDVLYIGGDDLTLLLDAGFVFSFIKYLHEFLIQRVGLQKTGDYHKDRDNISALSPINLGYSLGISIFPNNMPLYMALYTTNELESMAKKKSKKRNIKHGGTITVAFQRFIGIPSKHIIHDIYGPKNGNIKLTAWPRSYDELFDRRKGILPKIKQLLAHDISANKILRFIKVDDIDADEIKLKINYAAARMSKSRQDEASLLRELARFSFIILDDILSFQLRDIVDIMRTVHENERLLAVS